MDTQRGCPEVDMHQRWQDRNRVRASAMVRVTAVASRSSDRRAAGLPTPVAGECSASVSAAAVVAGDGDGETAETVVMSPHLPVGA